MADENNNIKTCPKDCLKCHPNQRLYCAAQMSRIMLDRMDELQDRFERLEDRVKRMEHADESVFNPLEETQEAAV
jgi:hypothetical protein